MKKLLLALAVVGATLFTACNKDQNCGHEFIEYDNTKKLVGTWTYLEEGQAEAMVIKEDGSFTITGVMNGGVGALYEEKGTIKVVNNKVTLAYNSGDVFEGRLELVAGKSLSIVLFEKENIRLTYNYCENDLADEVVGMWVCNDGPSAGKDMAIITYSENGKMTMTAESTSFVSKDLVNVESDYVVVGDLIFKLLPKGNVGEGLPKYIASRLIYTPNGTSLGDILTETSYLVNNDFEVIETTSTFLRVKEGLNLAGKTYDYKSAYVTNAKGKDEDFTIMGNTFNIDKIKAYDFDKMFGGDLFCVELNANSFKYKLRLDNGQDTGFDTPMTIDGNKVTLDMNAINPALRKVEMYMFQDANDTQVHIYMHTDAFINYFANMEVYTLILEGKIDPTDTAAIEKVFADMEARVESINVSFVMKARK